MNGNIITSQIYNYAIHLLKVYNVFIGSTCIVRAGAGALVTFDGDFCKESMCNEGTKKFSFNLKLLQHPSY